MTSIRSVPYNYSRKLNEKDSDFIDVEYSSIIKKGPQIIPALISELTDTMKTKIIDKCTGDYFTMGQLSYILIDNIENIPFFKVTGDMADVMQNCSNLAFGVLDYVRLRGPEFQKKYKKYFYSEIQKKH